jgi:hypothetical protein
MCFPTKVIQCQTQIPRMLAKGFAPVALPHYRVSHKSLLTKDGQRVYLFTRLIAASFGDLGQINEFRPLFRPELKWQFEPEKMEELFLGLGLKHKNRYCFWALK